MPLRYAFVLGKDKLATADEADNVDGSDHGAAGHIPLPVDIRGANDGAGSTSAEAGADVLAAELVAVVADPAVGDASAKEAATHSARLLRLQDLVPHPTTCVVASAIIMMARSCWLCL